MLEAILRPRAVENTPPFIRVLPGSSKSTASDSDLEQEFLKSIQRMMAEEPGVILTHDEIEEQIRSYEHQYGFSSAQMLEMVANNTAPDDYEIMDWRILLGHQ